MKKLLFLLALLPSLSLSAFRTDWLQNTTSSVTINGTTYYWQAGTGSSGQFLTTNGAVQPIVTWTTPSTSGGGGSPLEVFSNFDATRTSPTLSISIGDSLLMGVSGSTAVLNVDISSVTFGLITASSVSSNYITLSSVSANFLTQSSATATYFPIISSTTLLTTSSATANFLTLSSGAATYFQINSSNTFIQNRNTLQPGATFFVSSGTANNFNSTTANINTLNFTTMNGSPWGAANLVPYLNAGNVLATDPFFFYFDSLDILFAPSILGTTQMGSAYGAPVVMYDDDLSNFVGFESSGTMTTDTVYTLPNAAGSANQVWVLDGSNKFQNRYVNQIMKFSQVFNPEQAKVPGDAPCIVTNSVDATVPGILCDASSDEYVTWSTVLTPYTTTTMVADIYYTMVSTNAGNVVHNISVMCASSTYTPALDTASFGPVNASTVTVPGAIGRMGVARVTLSSMDTGCNSGSMFIVKYNRDANASADTAPGDIYVRKVWLYEP